MDVRTAQYFKVDTRKLSLAECWRMAPGLGFVVLALLKLVRIPLNLRTATPYPERILRIDPSELDQDGRRARLADEFAALQNAGFTLEFLHRHPTIDPDGGGLAAAFLSADRTTYASVVDTVKRRGKVTVRRQTLGLATALPGGRYIVTSSDSKRFESPPEWGTDVPRKRKPVAVVARHQERLRAEGGGGERIDPSRIEDFAISFERSMFDYQRRRGVLVEMTETEVERLRSSKPRAPKRFGLGRIALAWSLAPIVFVGGWAFQLLRWDASDYDYWTAETSAIHQCAVGEPATSTGSLFPEMGEVALDGSPRAPMLAALIEDPESLVQTRERLAPLAPETVEDAAWGSLLVFRARDGRIESLRPLAVELGRMGEEIRLDDPARAGSLGLQLRWEASGEGPDRAADGIESYLIAPHESFLVAPWAGAGTLSETESGARETYLRLQGMPDIGLLDALWLYVSSIWTTFTGPSDWNEYLRKEVDRERERVEAKLESDSDLDRDTAERYLAWQASLYDLEPEDPFASTPEPNRALAELARHLGRLSVATDPTGDGGQARVTDPRHRWSASGWMYRNGGSYELHGLSFEDLSFGLPAIVDYVCRSGADSIEYSLEGVPLQLSTEAAG